MFDIEGGFLRHTKVNGRKQAVELMADINQYTRLYTPKEPVTEETAEPSLDYNRALLDYNEHFIELSNCREYLRTLFFMLAMLECVVVPAIPIGMVIAAFVAGGVDFATIFSLSILFGALFLACYLWPLVGAPILFTFLRARYRFNRTTRKVYVLRPARYGGNVVLDWDRVQAHVNWRDRGRMTYEELADPVARMVRQNSLESGCVVLYWPPFDANDPERKGEEVIWTGDGYFFGECLWQYIRTFMEEGIDAVPVPNELEWLRKGYSRPDQYFDEVDLHLARAMKARARSRGEESAATLLAEIIGLTSVIWSPLHSLSERLCSWPTFPEEWNSDCGQRRRESGIGPEEPLRWEAR